MSEAKSAEILLVEDNPADVGLTRGALHDAKIANNLNVVGDGVEAMAYVRREGKYANAPVPDLILLDLNLPKKDGRTVLAEIKADERLKRIPVVVLTTSIADEDVYRAYGLHANCYICKPVDFGQFVRIVNSLEDFWLSLVKLPPKTPPV
jgi:CheY-like chemotaxis protein